MSHLYTTTEPTLLQLADRNAAAGCTSVFLLSQQKGPSAFFIPPSWTALLFSDSGGRRHTRSGSAAKSARPPSPAATSATQEPTNTRGAASDVTASMNRDGLSPGRSSGGGGGEMGPFEFMFKAAALAGNLFLGLGAITKVCRAGLYRVSQCLVDTYLVVIVVGSPGYATVQQGSRQTEP